MAKTELEVLEDISKKMDESKELQKTELQTIRQEAKDNAVKYEAEVKKLTDDLTAKGATIEQMQTEVKALNAKNGRANMSPLTKSLYKEVALTEAMIAGKIVDNKDNFALAASEKGFITPIKIDTKAVNISSSSNSANYLEYLPFQPGMEPTGQTRFREIFPTIQSSEDFVSFPRANTPVGAGSFNRQTEAASKSQVDRGYTMVTLTLKPMAGYAIASRQSLRNIPFLQSWLPTSLMEQLQDSEDTDFANSLVAAATGSSTTTGITVAAERLIYFIKNLRKQKFSANAIMIDPDKWADILVTKPQNYSLPNVVTIDTNGGVKVLGRSVYDVNWLTGGRVLVGDTRKAAIVQSEGLTLRQADQHASTFITNEVTFLLERTEGLAIFRPDAFITTVM